MIDFMDKILCGNNVEVLKQFPAKCVDLIVTSPPYDDLRIYKGYTFDFEGIAQQCYRVLKDGGVMVWVVRDQIIDGKRTLTSFKQSIYFEQIGFWMHDIMLYMKYPKYPDSKRYTNCFEFMFVFSKGNPKTVNLLRDRENLHQYERWAGTERQKNGEMRDIPRIKIVQETGVLFNAWFMNASTAQEDKTACEHPASFPDLLAERHILSWSNPDDLVLDVFLGSGTTAKMAYLNHRHYCGIDISQQYCDLAEKRVHLMSPAKYQRQNVKTMSNLTQNLGEY